ncbi:MarR family winged helix-turn-helix transcriptional regulator [Konateibacter massiliensis]|uniref:MarR family winged helix-turn-helix transcriptional regulator n=1 Tax=Konateibacter massiliensis TaxID=2002841 RepID=UPI000C147540|nr:MarR family transcriptional regulator [Konateibacter massiliensis]
MNDSNSDIEQLLDAFYDTFYKTEAVYERFAKLHGLTSHSLFVLHVLYKNPEGCTQRFICEQLHYPKQTVNTILVAFEKKDLITKETVAADKRNKYILLTKKGQEYAKRILSNMFQIEETAFSNMTAAERIGLVNGERAFLTHLTNGLRRLEAETDLSTEET